MKRTLQRTSAALALSAMILSACQSGEQQQTPQQLANSADGGTAACPSQVYWGDTHLHTANSADAVFNGVRLTTEDALRFARGDQVRSTTGLDAQLSRPLDFLVVSDHAEVIGIGRRIAEGDPELISDPTIRRWHEMMNESLEQSTRAARELIVGYAQDTLPERLADPELARETIVSTWQEHLEAVERYNEPGTFTSFIGYEYTSMPTGNNLHRVVMFRDGTDVFGDTLPFPANQSQDPEDLWAYLAAYEERTGGRAMAIPHNANLSNGLMFAMTDFEGGPPTRDYAERRQRWEPIVEVTQFKGDGEAHPTLSPDDEFADFGNTGWDTANLDASAPKEPGMFAGEYAREALKRGLLLESLLGVNPFQFGMIGATDSHTALATGDEDNYFGKFVADEPNANRAASSVGAAIRGRVGWQYLAGGYAGVWAGANSRAALFDAMARREVYATTGPRMTVRLFAGWGLSEADLGADPCSLYDRAVPMGGNLAGTGEAPRFLVTALMDPEGAHLDRIQIVKGWLDADGELQERVYDVAWGDADERSIDAEGNLAPVGNTVNLETATYENSIGDPELRMVWTDPDFDPSERAFYYVRVLEIPTPRWPVYDRLRFGADIDPQTELVAQERAYSSQVWYSPEA
ncbi:DUF3604 domain-containing protein [Parasphingopyxis algicola]|uniref:DUF3604 domain-containing protein n=1 Tax=Parasphingopyxis algicola TaxID=2026624 RepID=UPI0015A4A542|nr:DUF3604 domain-containing protein [Parasphingopyxis algicola]QLC26031.1 DUF3604 domain-containing protein [Parasphingopyxis algicola]